MEEQTLPLEGRSSKITLWIGHVYRRRQLLWPSLWTLSFFFFLIKAGNPIATRQCIITEGGEIKLQNVTQGNCNEDLKTLEKQVCLLTHVMDNWKKLDGQINAFKNSPIRNNKTSTKIISCIYFFKLTAVCKKGVLDMLVWHILANYNQNKEKKLWPKTIWDRKLQNVMVVSGLYTWAGERGSKSKQFFFMLIKLFWLRIYPKVNINTRNC